MVLVGFMGAGKSTVGPLLAERLGWRFVDLDREIERRAGAPVHRIFATAGEAEFRRLEREATSSLRPLHHVVLAAGGGWFLDPDANSRLGAAAVVVWLRVGLDEALRRLADSAEPRPLLSPAHTRGAAARLLREREPAYARADFIVDVDDRSAADIAEHIRSLIAGD